MSPYDCLAHMVWCERKREGACVYVWELRGHFDRLSVFVCGCICDCAFLKFQVNYSEDILCGAMSHIRNDDETLPLCLLNGSEILSLAKGM